MLGSSRLKSKELSREVLENVVSINRISKEKGTSQSNVHLKKLYDLYVSPRQSLEVKRRVEKISPKQLVLRGSNPYNKITIVPNHRLSPLRAKQEKKI